jgi:hypothetical protein
MAAAIRGSACVVHAEPDFAMSVWKAEFMVLAVTLTAAAQQASAQQPDDPRQPSIVETETVYYDFIDDAGNLTGGKLLLPIDAAITELQSTKAIIDNRIDLVTVGDGYQAAQLGAYATHAANAVNAFFAQQPFQRYQHFYRVHQIDVISVDSGVDNDPTQGILRNTAMDMAFWCNNIERLLCVNVSKAYQFAGAAPDVDQILAIANSDKYGGAGYTTSELATISGGNSAAAEIAIHEFGHSIGNLADEYDYNDGAAYVGFEHPSVNASTLTATQMASSGTKWAPWLSDNNPLFDGLVSTYQGCAYYQFGLYRPTSNSKMRALGRPFNLPSVESLIIEMYKIVRPIDDFTSFDTLLNGTETLGVTPMPVEGGPALSVQWSLDGSPIAGATDVSLELTSVCMDQNIHEISVAVTDPTTWVRNEAARVQWMTDSRTWFVQISGCVAGRLQAPATVVDVNDLLFVINNWGAADSCADIAPAGGDGDVNIDDLLAVINSWGPCP